MRSVYLMIERIIPTDCLHTITCFYEFFWISATPFTSCMCPYPEGLLHLVQPALGLGPRPFLEKHHHCAGGHKDLHCSQMGTST